MTTKTILDVSRYQGEINWAIVKASDKIDGVMLKTVSTNKAFGGIYIDPTFEYNYSKCKQLGIPVGVYYYTYAQTRAQADAELAKLKEALTGKTLEMPVAVDVEDNKLTPISVADLTDLVAYAANTIEGWGLYAMVYTYTSYANTELYMGGAALSRYDIWLADYTGKTPKVSFPYGMHQYTSAGSVPGISGKVDLSRTSRDYPAIIQRAGLTRLREV